ncbi:CPBP family intramembrane metalloprotease [Paenibacillus sp. MER 180]|uniref:CPBP family intramembrane glutamic endopeptidase n=1 Tax=Paenibacillus sp. MER 180 TaxID=2939570 RepID=UPI00204251AE|nr:CPBP family intramembrane glutamic endopeptidase [Paenibacillus sp. MER 180]MCM3293134.1 CPBP family intramembrane metalloprotease [Paenibacillus sp. MER 180]
MSLWGQILLCGVVGALVYCGLYVWTPKLVNRGVSLLFSFWFFLWSPVLLLIPLSILLYWIDGGVLSLASFVERFRLTPINSQDWLWVIGAVVFTILFDQLLEPVGKYFARKRLFAPPPYLPAPFNPLKKFSIPPTEFFHTPLRRNGKLLAWFIPLHLIAMFSEELMWRGYMLPLQIELFGSYAWVVNGLLWAWLIHACLKWHFIGMLPGMLIAPWIAQYTGSTWASFAAHAIGNAPLWVLLWIGVMHTPTTKVDKGC